MHLKMEAGAAAVYTNASDDRVLEPLEDAVELPEL
jgi:hypothetical protein